MFIRLGMSMAIIAVIFVFSPVRRGEDPARLIAGAKDAMLDTARRKATEAALAASGAATVGELRPTIEALVARALAEDPRPDASAPAAAAPRAALDTLTAADRRPAWKGMAAG